MAIEYFNFDDSSLSKYIYNPDEIEISSGTAKLKMNYPDPNNILLNQSPTTDATVSNNLSRITDGLTGDYADIQDSVALNQNIKFDLLSEKKLNELKILDPTGTTRDYLVIRVSVDNTDWDYVYNSDYSDVLGLGIATDEIYTGDSQFKVIDLNGVQARYIEIYPGPDRNSQLIELDEIELYEFSYPINKVPVLKCKLTELCNVLSDLVKVTTETNSELRYNIQADDIVYYFDGVNVVRYKEDYFQKLVNENQAFYKANTEAQILAQWSSIQNNYSMRNIYIWLHFKSNDGSSSPIMDWISLTYSLDTTNQSFTSEVEVFGAIKDFGMNPVEGLRVLAILVNAGALNQINSGFETLINTSLSTVTNMDGSWTLALTRTEDLIDYPNAKWEISVDSGGKYLAVSIMNTAPSSVDIKTLIEEEKLSA